VAGVPFYAKRFVSGLQLSESLIHLEKLSLLNISSSLDLLGENVKTLNQTKEFTQEYLRMLDAIAAAPRKLNSHVSLKLTMLGLDISPTACEENLYQILEKADKLNIRVCLDMEGTKYTEVTMQIYEKACSKFRSPEIVLQAYLHRTKSDVERVLKANGRFRLCKGAYKESATNAIQKMPEIVENYKLLVSHALLNANYVCIATHDDQLIEFCKAFIVEHKVPKSRYEFQMLYGMRSETWKELASAGHPFTVYMPYGADWKAYYSRRLAERKENVFFVLKNMFRK
jgi:proline dehydrogenase